MKKKIAAWKFVKEQIDKAISDGELYLAGSDFIIFFPEKDREKLRALD